MLLIILLGLIAKLVLVCDSCDVETFEMNNFDFTKVGVNVKNSIDYSN